MNTNALAAHQLHQLQNVGAFGNILGPVNINAIKAHQLGQSAHKHAKQSGLYHQGQPQKSLLNLAQPQQFGIQIVSLGNNPGLQGQGHGLHPAQMAWLKRQLLRRAHGRYQSQGRLQGQGQTGNIGLSAKQLQYLGLLAQSQGQIPKNQGKGEGYLRLLKSQKQGQDNQELLKSQEEPKNYLEFLQSQNTDQDLLEILADSDYESYDGVEDDDDDGEVEPTYATNAQGEVVNIADAKNSNSPSKHAKIGGLTSLIGGHLEGLGEHFTGHSVELHEIGGYGSHGGHGGGHGGGGYGHVSKLIF